MGQKRQPRGTNKGGQFAPDEKSEAETALPDEADGLFCHECGGEMFVSDDGVSHHASRHDMDGIDYYADADHVAFPDEPVTFDTLNRRALLSPEYREEHERLLEDPIVKQMAEELPAGRDISEGWFTTSALDEYSRRGGTQAKTIGSVGNAIRVLYDRRLRAERSGS